MRNRLHGQIANFKHAAERRELSGCGAGVGFRVGIGRNVDRAMDVSVEFGGLADVLVAFRDSLANAHSDGQEGGLDLGGQGWAGGEGGRGVIVVGNMAGRNAFRLSIRR